MSVQRVLVTGASGFTGGHLCQRLAREGYTVRAMVRKPNERTDLQSWEVEQVFGDMRDPESLRRATKGIDIVYHIAAVYRQANLTLQEMREVNVQGTRNLLDAAVHAGVQRFVHCSSMGVHGAINNPPGNEEAPYAPGDDYQVTKREGEQIARQYVAEGRLPVVVFRPTGIYGPGDLRFLKLFRAIKRRRFIMLGSGEVNYHMIYIDDLIDGVLLCGTIENSVGGVYILGGEASVTLNHLVQVIADVLGVRRPRFHFPVTPVYLAGFLCELICNPFGIDPPLYRRRVDFFRKNRAFDVAKAKRELGFEPKIDLAKGIRLTAEWYQTEGLL